MGINIARRALGFAYFTANSLGFVYFTDVPETFEPVYRNSLAIRRQNCVLKFPRNMASLERWSTYAFFECSNESELCRTGLVSFGVRVT